MFRCAFRLMLVGALLAGGAYMLGYRGDDAAESRVRAAGAAAASGAAAAADRLAERASERADALAERASQKADAIAERASRQADALSEKVDREGIREAGSDIAAKIGAQADRAGAALAETRLTAKIRAKMTLDDTIDGSDIDVDTAGTVVTLRGSIPNQRDRQRVLQLARETEGVTSVVDRLELTRP
jgi:hyperosmotically inducible periplasmic protein